MEKLMPDTNISKHDFKHEKSILSMTSSVGTLRSDPSMIQLQTGIEDEIREKFQYYEKLKSELDCKQEKLDR